MQTGFRDQFDVVPNLSPSSRESSCAMTNSMRALELGIDTDQAPRTPANAVEAVQDRHIHIGKINGQFIVLDSIAAELRRIISEQAEVKMRMAA